MDNEQDWRFCVVGNIVKTHLDEEGITRYGTKAYTGGTKVYIDARGWFRRDYGKDWVCVIGRNRFGRYALESVPLDLIENIRTSRVFKPTVLKIFDHVECMDGWHWWGRTSEDRREAKEFVKMMTEKPPYLTIKLMGETYAKGAEEFPRRLKEAEQKLYEELKRKYSYLDLPFEELLVYDRLLEKYEDSPAKRSEQGRIRFEVETEGILPSALAEWEEMF